MQKDYFIIIPPELRKSTKFTLSEKMVLSTIMVLAKKEGYAWMSNNTLAKDLGISRRTVIRAIQALEEKQAITISRFMEGETERRTITPSQGVVTKFHWGGAKMSLGGVSECHPNITSDNITSEYNTGNSSLSGQRPENLESVVHLFGQHNHPRREAESFYHYYESIGWVVGKNPVKNWVALAKKWMSKIKPSKTYKILT
jgi:hypothetical protein